MRTSDFDRRRSEVEAFNKKSRCVKRGIAAIPIKFAVSLNLKTFHQAREISYSISKWEGTLKSSFSFRIVSSKQPHPPPFCTRLTSKSYPPILSLECQKPKGVAN